MRRAAHQANLEVADIASRHPDRFGFFATLMLLNSDDAIAETSFAFDELGADGLFMPTNVGKVYLGDRLYDPLFAELDRRGAAVFVHPLALPCPLVTGIVLPGRYGDVVTTESPQRKRFVPWIAGRSEVRQDRWHGR